LTHVEKLPRLWHIGAHERNIEPAGWKYEGINPRQTWIIAMPDRAKADAKLNTIADSPSMKSAEMLSAEELGALGLLEGETLCL
jgi:hypothetical protein